MSIVKSILSVLTRDVFLYFVNIITGVLIARKLGPEILGIWFIINLIPLYAESFFRIKSDVASVYFFGQNKYDKHEILKNINFIAIIFSIAFIILVLLVFDPIYFFLCKNCSNDYSLEFMIILIQVPIQFISLNYSYYHISQDNIKIFNFKAIVYSISYGFISISLLYFFDLEIWSVILGSILGHLFSLIYGIYNVDNHEFKIIKVNFKFIKSLMKYGFNFYLFGIINFFQNEGVKNISLIFLQSSGIAFLGQGKNIGDLMFKINSAIETILYPNLSRTKNKLKSINNVVKSFRISFFFMLIIGLFLFQFSEYLIELLYGIEFIKSAFVLKILIPGIIFMGSSSVLNSYYNANGMASIVPKVAILPAIIQLFIGYFLTKKYGLTGASIAISVGFFIQAIITIIVFFRVNNLNYKFLIPQREDFLDLRNFISNNIYKL